MSEYEIEPIPGLPGIPPPGERILWQGSPEWRALARNAFHTRLIAGYFALLLGWAVLAAASNGTGDLTGVITTAVLGVIVIVLLHLLAWGSARSTIYTLTNRRIVLRIGIAVPKCINLPLGMIASVDLAVREDGTGDLPLTLSGAPKLGFLALWPHARPWEVVRPQPMMRSVPDAATVAALVARTCLAVSPEGQISATESPAAPVSAAAPTPAYGEVVAA